MNVRKNRPSTGGKTGLLQGENRPSTGGKTGLLQGEKQAFYRGKNRPSTVVKDRPSTGG